MTFSDRSPLLLGGIVAVLIVIGTALGLSLEAGGLRSGYEVTAEFDTAVGLSRGDPVLIAGLPAGTISSVDISDDGYAEVGLRIEDHPLPADSRARVVLRSLVGLRSVQLTATGSWSDQLADGDRIPIERTSVPVDIPEVADASEALLNEADTEAFDLLLGSVTDITRGQRDQVAELVDGGTELADIITDREAEIRDLLDRLREVAAAVGDRDEELLTVVDDLGDSLGQLADQRDDVRELLRQTNATSGRAADLVEDERDAIDAILDEFHDFAGIADRHQLDIAETIAYLGPGIEGFASIAFSGEEEVPWANIFTTSAGPAGIDIVGGCGGLLDQALDEVLGPDPRSCAELENRTPGEREEQETPASPLLDGARESALTTGELSAGPARQGDAELEPRDGSGSGGAGGDLDAVARRVLPGGRR